MDLLSTGSERTNIGRVATASPFTLNTFSPYKTLVCFFTPTGCFFGGWGREEEESSRRELRRVAFLLGFDVCEVTHVYFSSPIFFVNTLGNSETVMLLLSCCCCCWLRQLGNSCLKLSTCFFSFRSCDFILIENSLLVLLLSKETNHRKERT